MATRAGFLAALLFVASWLAGCQLVLGDFEVEEVAGGTAQCSQKYRCNGPWLFCETKSGRDFRLIDTCASEVQCDSMEGRCTVCMPGEFRCSGARLETCNVDGTAWALVDTCDTADECNLNSRSCRACTPGEMPQCRGVDQTELFECGPDQHWVSLGVCATQPLCQRSAEAIAADPMTARACLPPACPEPGAFRCEPDGVSLSRCAPDLTAWTPVDTCASAELCTATLADPVGADARGGKCVAPGCFPAGSVQCVDERLERCPDSLVAWDPIQTCEPPYQCNTNAEACTGPCVEGDLQCSGAVLQRCTAAQVWADDATCVNASLCQVTLDPDTELFVGGCVEPACPTPGEVRCNDVLLERCNNEQTAWAYLETCPSAALCNANDERCDPVGCEPARSQRCNPVNPSLLERCPDTLLGWEAVTTCAPTQACNTDLAGPPCIDQCPDPPERCSAVAYETCSGVTGAPVWTAQATCRTAELCNCGLTRTCSGYAPDGVCGLPVCGANLGSTRCMGANLETCQPGRNGWNVTQDCTAAANCVPGTPADMYFDGGYCAVCSVASERQCNGTTAVRTCSADRRAWLSTEACAPFACINSGTNDYCGQCTPGHTRCANGDVQLCGANSLWGAGSDCGTFLCIENGNADYCAACTPGQTRCTNGDVQTCGANSLWGPPADCGTFACVDNGTADYCGVCTAGHTRCSAGDVQTCGANLLWGAAADCGTFACVDNGNADYCGECTPGHTRCVTGGVQTCGADALWGSAADCGTFTCVENGNADYCGECTAGHTRCASGDLEVCNNGAQWRPGDDCGTFMCIDNGNADYCGECTPGHTRCASGDVELCSAGAQWGPGDDCGTFMCVDSGTADYCGVCTAGHTRCNAGDVQTCGTNLLWGGAADCGTFACVENGNADYCGECTPGETLCSSGSLLTCGAGSLWDAGVACTFGCVNDDPDFCAECTVDTDCTTPATTCTNGRCI